jgi:asparagine synthase (glutamine-hydrolysing)
MGLVAVAGIQLWHHLYFGGGLCDLPTWTPPQVDDCALLPSADVRSEAIVEVTS